MEKLKEEISRAEAIKRVVDMRGTDYTIEQFRLVSKLTDSELAGCLGDRVTIVKGGKK